MCATNEPPALWKFIVVGVEKLAETNLGVVRQTYELGATNLLDYIAEQRRYIEIKDDFIDAQLQAYLARVEILRAVAAK